MRILTLILLALVCGGCEPPVPSTPAKAPISVWDQIKAEQQANIEQCKALGGAPITAVIGGPQLLRCDFPVVIQRP